MRFVSVEEMRLMDKYAIENNGIASYELMERAGRGVAEKITDFLINIDKKYYRRFVIFAGKGNNGGDAYVVARYLMTEFPELNIIIYSVCDFDKLTGDALINAQNIINSYHQIAVKNIDYLDDNYFSNGDVIIDGLLGTGLSGKLREPYEQFINIINRQNLLKIAIDIPSGMNGDTGLPINLDNTENISKNNDNLSMIKADFTVTIGAPKWGLINHTGAEYCGQIKVVDIGLDFFATASENEMIFAEDVNHYFTRRSVYNHKNSVGRVLFITGSIQYPGAAFLGAISALRSGAGFVHLAVPKGAKIYNTSNIHSLVMHQIDDNNRGTFTSESIPQIQELIDKVDTIVIGSGLTTATDNCAILNYIKNKVKNKIIIYDADALNLISQNINLLDFKFEKNITILTPHVGEMNRLLQAFDLSDYSTKPRHEQATALAKKTSSIIVLKGHHTIIATPTGRFNVNSSGNIALATAGTGDCLAGIIGAFTANLDIDNYNSCLKAISYAVYIHGYAAEFYPYAKRSFIADDLFELIPQAMVKLSLFA